MRLTWLASIGLAASLVGCSGLKLQEADINRNPPDDWKNRSFMRNTSDFRFHLTENVGLIVTPVPGDKYDVVHQPVLPDRFTPREDIIKDGTVYKSIVTKAAAAKGGYLTFAADLSASDAVDFSIVDVSRADVPWPQFPEAQLRAAAAMPNPNHIQRLWIQSLILTRVVSTSSTVLDCNGEATAPTFKTSATCHTEAGTTANDYGIAAVFVDIDKWAANNPDHSASTGPAAAHADTILKLLNDVQAMAPGQPGVRPTLPPYISVQPFPGELRGFRRE